MPFARMIWKIGGSVGRLWDFWTTTDEEPFIEDDYGHKVYKTYKTITYYGVQKVGSEYHVIVMSPNSDAAKIRVYDESTGTSRTYFSNDTITDVNGRTWFVNRNQAIVGFDVDPDFLVAGKTDMLNKIFEVPFYEEYLSNHMYDMFLCTNFEKVIRKAVGIFLHFNIANYYSHVAYQTFSDNIEDIISTQLAKIDSDAKYVQVNINTFYPSSGIQLIIYHYKNCWTGFMTSNWSTVNGYRNVYISKSSAEGTISDGKREQLDVNNSGVMTYSTSTASESSSSRVGIYTSSNINIVFTNIGADL